MGPLVILEDDPDDQQLIGDALREVGFTGDTKFFVSPREAIQYLAETPEQPFLILTDMNLPEMNGLEFQKKIHENEALRKKSIPFVFFSTSDHPYIVSQAYDQVVQGYFQKPLRFDQLKNTLHVILEYWKLCKHPNSGKQSY